MKKIPLLLLLLIAPVLSFSQEYLNDMAIDTCLCIDNDIVKLEKPMQSDKITYKIILCVI